MPSVISLFGLNEEQKWLAQQLWSCDSLDEVADLRDSLDEAHWHDLFLVMELIWLADVDSAVFAESDCADAIDIMEKLRYDADV
jgi:hypothetical protein